MILVMLIKDTKQKEKNKSPFKDQEELRKELTEFINTFKTTIVNHSKRISDYFEMGCFNNVVKFYKAQKYTTSIQGLQQGEYRYKCGTSGIQSNFSFFKVSKEHNKLLLEFEIHHNLAVQSAHNRDIFTTPDIAIIKANGLKIRDDIYEAKRRFSYVAQEDLITFCEAKHFNPYPELLFNFIGTVNELRPAIINGSLQPILPAHLAPSLMISGVPNKHTSKIKESIESRYCLNIVYNLFHSPLNIYSKSLTSKLQTTDITTPKQITKPDAIKLLKESLPEVDKKNPI